MKKFNLILMVICFLSIAYSELSSQVSLNWAARFNGPGGSDDGIAVIEDTVGNVITLGQTGLAGNSDIVLIKKNYLGDTVWVRKLNGPGESEDIPIGLRSDIAGNIYITATTLAFPSGYNMLLAKYDQSGNLLWSKTYNGPGNSEDRITDFEISTSGEIYVAGESTGSGTGLDCTILKYNSLGTLQWERRKNGTGNSTDRANDLFVSGSNEIYVAATLFNTGTLSDYTTIKYNSSGTELWSKTYNGPANNNDNAQSIAVDQSGNVYVTGRIFSAATSFDYATVKHSPLGDTIWSRTYNGPPGNAADISRALKIDPSGNVWVTGYSTGTGTGFDYTTIKYNSSGVQQFVKRYNGPGNGGDLAFAMDIDPFGNAYVTGQSVGVGTGNDYATIKYNTNGDTVWVARYNGTGNGGDAARSIFIDNLYNVFVTGQSFGTTDNDIVTIKYSQASANRNLKARSIVEAFYDSLVNSLRSDTVTMVLTNSFSPYNTVDQSKGILDTIGKGTFTFANASNGTTYYLLAKHRNSIETWSASPVVFIADTLNYDFTTSASKAYGNNQVQVDASPVNYAIYSGDVNQEGTIDLSDILLVYNAANIFTSGYVPTDVNGDNFVDLSDMTSTFNNAANFVSVVRP